MKPTHTPTPWNEINWMIYKDNKPIVQCLGECKGADESECLANARHIVKCVNCHEELIGLLQITLEVLQDTARNQKCSMTWEQNELYKDIQQALLKAESKE